MAKPTSVRGRPLTGFEVDAEILPDINLDNKSPSFIVNCAKLASVADAFLLPNMENIIARKLSEDLDSCLSLHVISMGLQSSRSSSKARRAVVTDDDVHAIPMNSENFSDQLSEAIRLAYRRPNATRRVFADFIFIAKDVFYKLDKIQELSDEVL